jgi:diguanylate cyclase
LSAGVAQYRTGERLADWVERADQALFAAKKGGRNRVVLDGAAAPGAAEPPPVLHPA